MEKTHLPNHQHLPTYPLVICYIAIENDHRNSGITYYRWWFSSSQTVKLPEGMLDDYENPIIYNSFTIFNGSFSLSFEISSIIFQPQNQLVSFSVKGTFPRRAWTSLERAGMRWHGSNRHHPWMTRRSERQLHDMADMMAVSNWGQKPSNLGKHGKKSAQHILLKSTYQICQICKSWSLWVFGPFPYIGRFPIDNLWRKATRKSSGPSNGQGS